MSEQKKRKRRVRTSQEGSNRPSTAQKKQPSKKRTVTQPAKKGDSRRSDRQASKTIQSEVKRPREPKTSQKRPPKVSMPNKPRREVRPEPRKRGNEAGGGSRQRFSMSQLTERLPQLGRKEDALSRSESQPRKQEREKLVEKGIQSVAEDVVGQIKEGVAKIQVQWPGMNRKDTIDKDINLQWPDEKPAEARFEFKSDKADGQEDSISDTESRKVPDRVYRLNKKKEDEERERQMFQQREALMKLGQPIAARQDITGKQRIQLYNVVFHESDLEYVAVFYQGEIRNILLQYDMYMDEDDCPYNQVPRSTPYIVVNKDIYEIDSFVSINYQDRVIN